MSFLQNFQALGHIQPNTEVDSNSSDSPKEAAFVLLCSSCTICAYNLASIHDVSSQGNAVRMDKLPFGCEI